MERKKLWKQGLSLLLVLVMALSIGISPLPEGLFTLTVNAAGNTFSLPKSDLALGANVVPTTLTGDSSFMETYVYRGSMSLNSYFRVSSEDQSNKYNGDVLKYTDTIERGKKKGRKWQVYYRWDPTEKQKSLLADDSYVLNFKGNATSEYHTRTYTYDWKTYKHKNAWDRAQIGIKTNRGEIWSHQSKWEKSGTAVPTSWSRASFYVDYIEFFARAVDCKCGYSGATGNVFYMVDNSVPRITDVYVCTDKNNPSGSRVKDGAGFSASSTVTSYIVMEFSEKVRFSDNTGKELSLNLDAYDRNTGVALDEGTIKAKLISFENNKMIFQYSVPSTINGKPTDIRISGLSNNQKEFANGSFDLKLYDGDGNSVDVGFQKSRCYVTDIAGNSIDWNRSDKWLGNIVYDNVKPTMKNVTLNGNMVNSASKKGMVDGVDRSAIFAGVGDWVEFNVYFSEDVKLQTSGSMSMILNIKDANGNPIKVACSQQKDKNRILSSRVNLTEDLLAEDMAGKQIYVTGIEGITKITDGVGNVMNTGSNYAANLSSITLKPAEQVYVDTDAPVISTTLTPDESGVYTPIVSSQGQVEYFTFPIKIGENTTNTDISKTSWVEPQKASFALMRAAGGNAFGWYVDYSETVDLTKFQTGTTVTTQDAKYTYSPVEGTTAYIHFKLDENVDYGYRLDAASGFWFDAEIFVKVQDNAGNTSSATYKISQMVDDEEPTGSVDTYAEKVVDYTNLVSSMTTSFSVKDNMGLKQVAYYWTYMTKDAAGEDVTITTDKQTIDLSASLQKEYTGSASLSIPFYVANDYGRTGSAYLTIEYYDYAGYNGVVTGPTHTYDFTKAKSEYTIVGGTKENPIYVPEVYIREPKASAGVGDNRTMMFIPYETNEDGTIDYLVYDPKYVEGTTGAVTIVYDESLDLIGEVFKYELEPDDVSVPGTWYMLTGKIENGAGTFTDVSSSPTGIYRTLKSYIKGSSYYDFNYGDNYPGVYGTQEIIIVTSADFDDNNFSFTAAKSIVESTTVYLGNDPKYAAEITAIRDDVSADAAERYCYVAGNVPERDLDNLEIEFKLSNISAGEAVAAYGFSMLDFANSKVELLYYKSKGAIADNAKVVHTWPLVEATTQSVVVPEGVATELGWYGIRVILATTDGRSSATVMDQKYLMDNREREAYFDTYYKSYDKMENGEVDETIEAVNLTKDNWDGTSDIEVALDMQPGEDWEVNTYFRFGSEYSSIGSAYDIEENVKFRAYNKNDADYEQNAIWFDVSFKNNVDFIPVYVEEITAESYGTQETPYLPLYAGDNLVSFEVVNTNGDVNYYEIPVYAHAKASEWEPKVEYSEVSERTGGIMEVQVSPAVSVDVDLENSTFAYLTDYRLTIKDVYTFRDDFDHEFYLLDQNGNLTAKHCAVSDVDGMAPEYAYINTVSGSGINSMGRVFYTVITAQDSEGKISADEIMLTFDTDYSAVLLGMTGEERINNTEQITIKVPVCTEKDENGNYIPWESFDTDNYGIFRTLVVEEDGAGTGLFNRIEVEIWGTWKSDFEGEENKDFYYEKGYDAIDKREITFTVLDANGNSESTTEVFDNTGYYNHYTKTAGELRLAFLDEDGEYLPGYNDSALPMVDEDGRVGVYSDTPLSKIYSYGATSFKEVEWEWGGQVFYQTTLPMISGDGVYTLEYMDLFGELYQTELVVNEYGEVGIEVEISESEFTNQNVIVKAASTLDGDYITSIVGVTAREGDEDVIGVIDETDPTKARIEMSENGYVVVTTNIGKERMVPITNIDKVLEPATILYVDSAGKELDGTETTLDEEITAIIECSEIIEGIEGRTNFVFPRGSMKGDTHTFKYKDLAGNEGTITAVLPCNISKAEREEGFVDTTAPSFEISAYGMRNSKYTLVTDLSEISGMNTETEEGIKLTEAYVQMLTGSEGLGSYVAQAYKLVLDIRDETETKMIALKPGSVAPVSYADTATGSQVQYVSVSKDAVTISENAEFDLYIIDEYDNVTSIPGIKVTSIDKSAPLYTVTYVVSDDKKSVRAIFIPENPAEALEVIYPLDKSMNSVKVESGVTDEQGDPYLVDRYFFTFTDNESRTFNYKDEYGNSGKSEASVQGFSTGVAVVTSVVWSGTADKLAPTETSRKVNKDITANLNVSKAISSVALYQYDEAAENGKGALLTAAPLTFGFTSENVYITYSANMDKVVVELIAAENGNAAYYTLPAVNCIDKVAPVVTVEDGQAVLSDDKRSMTITFSVDEPVVMTESVKAEFSTTHSWFTKNNEGAVLHFTDEAGNVTEYAVTQNSVVDTKVLTAVYSATENHADETTNPAKDFALEAGDAVWIKTNKAAEVVIGEAASSNVSADTWTKFVLPETEGIYMIKLTDSNTKEVSYKTLSVQLKDKIKPTITLDSAAVVLEQDATVAEMLQKIRSGVSITDNKDGVINTYEVTGYPQTVEPGLYELTYRATDSAGNTAVTNRTLYIMEEGMMALYVNGVPALPFVRTVIKGYDLSFDVENFGNEELLTMKIRSGIKSLGQMKRYTTSIENMETTVSEGGFYTIYVRTQERAEYVTYLYVEE